MLFQPINFDLAFSSVPTCPHIGVDLARNWTMLKGHGLKVNGSCGSSMYSQLYLLKLLLYISYYVLTTRHFAVVDASSVPTVPEIVQRKSLRTSFALWPAESGKPHAKTMGKTHGKNQWNVSGDFMFEKVHGLYRNHHGFVPKNHHGFQTHLVGGFLQAL